MNTQQYPEHILKQANEMETEAIMRHQKMFGMTSIEFDYLRRIIRDTLNLPALLMAQEQLSQHQQVVKQLVEALEKLARLGNGDKYGNSEGNTIAQSALATAKQLLEKKV